MVMGVYREIERARFLLEIVVAHGDSVDTDTHLLAQFLMASLYKEQGFPYKAIQLFRAIVEHPSVTDGMKLAAHSNLVEILDS